MSKNLSLFRQLPSVDKLLGMPALTPTLHKYGHTLTVQALRAILAQQRQHLHNGQNNLPNPDQLIQQAHQWLTQLTQPTLRPVINATGVIIHTNLGRAPLSQAAIQAIQEATQSYTTLEYSLEEGQRGSRSLHTENLLTCLTGAEAATVVNNNAAAVLLMLTALCQEQEVIISRGQLVEIGGGFRIPDVMAQSGCRLVEVGTTNRTHLLDYEAAITPKTGAILVTHPSNFQIIGFTSQPSLAELANLAHQNHLPLLYDQGSGALLDTGKYGLTSEPTVIGGLESGADLVTFSGDKLLGGPQAGILCGRGELIVRCKKHPLARAIRPDKLCLAGLSATLLAYLTDTALEQLPVWQMIAHPFAQIAQKANLWAEHLTQEGMVVQLQEGVSTVGGGSLPGSSLPTMLLMFPLPNPDQVAAQLRKTDPPVIVRVMDGCVVCDLRTVMPAQHPLLFQTLRLLVPKHL